MSPEPDAFLGGIVRLHQPPRGAHRAGTDAVLLARLLVPAPGERLCDVGAGTGAVGLACAALHPGTRPTLVERDPELAGMARTNAALNGIAASVIEADVLAPAVELAEGGFPTSPMLAFMLPKLAGVTGCDELVGAGVAAGEHLRRPGPARMLRAIAAELVVTDRAVEKHINSILTKLDLPAEAPVHRRVAATLVFLSEAGVGGGVVPRA